MKLKEKDDKKMVPIEVYSKMKSHLVALHKRHQAFRETILNGGNFNGSQLQQQHSQLYNYSSSQSMNNFINYQSSVPVLNLDENELINKETDYNYPSLEVNSTDKMRYQMVNLTQDYKN